MNANSRQVVAIAGASLLLLLLLPGCSEKRSNDSIHLDDLGLHCNNVACPRLEQMSGVLLVAGLHLQSDSDGPVLTITAGKSVEIRGATIAASHTAILWNPPAICPNCTLRIVDSHIEAGIAGVVVEAGNQLELLGTTIVSKGQSADMLGQVGIQLRNVPTVRLRDVTLEALVADKGDGLRVLTEAAVQATNVTVRRYASGLSGNISSLGPGPVIIECGLVGMDLSGPSVQVEGAHVKGCSQFGIKADRPNAVEVRRTNITRSAVGLETINSRSTMLFDVSLHENGYGARLYGGLDRTGSVERGQVTSNRYAGIVIGYDHVSIKDVQFVGNGASWPDPAAGPESWDYGGLVIDSNAPSGTPDLTVVACQFTGNAPYALSNTGFTTVQAANNWWASPEGPTWQPSALVDAALPLGPQAIFGPAAFVPWRMQP